MDKKIVIKKWLTRVLFLRTFFCDILYLFSNNKDKIKADLLRYKDVPYSKPNVRYLNYCLINNKPFRSVFYYRIKNHYVLCGLCKLMLKPFDTIEIDGDIDGGLLIYHNYCVIGPQRAGLNFTVQQGTTIGIGPKHNDEDKTNRPIIGDNVWVAVNAVVFGGIQIGNNVTIGAGSFVTKDFPDNCVVIGNPARIIRKEVVEGDIKLA